MKKINVQTIHTQYKAYKKWYKQTIKRLSKKGGLIAQNKLAFLSENYLSSYGQFKESYLSYEGKGSRLAKIKAASLYETDIKTAERAYEVIKQYGKHAVSLEKLRTMNTHEAVKEYLHDEIKEYAAQLEAEGYSNKDIAVKVAQYYFGS